MLKPLDSSAERRQLSGAVSTLSQSGAPLFGLPRPTGCMRSGDVCLWARQGEAPEAMQEGVNLTASESGKGPRANFRRGDKLGEAQSGLRRVPACGPRWVAHALGHSVIATAARSAGEPRAGEAPATRLRTFAALARAPAAAAAWVFPLPPKPAMSVPHVGAPSRAPSPDQCLPGTNPKGGNTLLVPAALLCACERGGSGPLASPPPGASIEAFPRLQCLSGRAGISGPRGLSALYTDTHMHAIRTQTSSLPFSLPPLLAQLPPIRSTPAATTQSRLGSRREGQGAGWQRSYSPHRPTPEAHVAGGLRQQALELARPQSRLGCHRRRSCSSCRRCYCYCCRRRRLLCLSSMRRARQVDAPLSVARWFPQVSPPPRC